MEKETYDLLISILEKREERALADGNVDKYIAYSSARDMVEYAYKNDFASLSQFDY